jgi:hypothetical protein
MGRGVKGIAYLNSILSTNQRLSLFSATCRFVLGSLLKLSQVMVQVKDSSYDI